MKQRFLHLARVLCRIKKKSFSRFPEPRGSDIFSGLGIKKIGGFILRMQRDFYYCTAVSTAKAGSPSFCVYPSFFCVYIFVLHIGCYYTLSMIVIYSINKYFIKSSFIQSAHVKGQFRHRDYM